MEWLDASGYEPKPMLDLDSLARDLETRPIEVLIADASLIRPVDLPSVIKTLTGNRPLILIGNPESAPVAVRRDASWLDRPVSIDDFKMAVALALAEGRPARRSRRKSVSYLHSTVDGMAAHLVDVSYEGVRLQLNGTQPSALAPYFTMRVPGFGVASVVKRVWVAQPDGSAVWCGGFIERLLPNSKGSWKDLVDTAPSSGEFLTQTPTNFV
jgi:hypothetical protein